jgi:hypothetical protein
MYLLRAAPAERAVLAAVASDLYESFERALQVEGVRLEPTHNTTTAITIPDIITTIGHTTIIAPTIITVTTITIIIVDITGGIIGRIAIDRL